MKRIYYINEKTQKKIKEHILKYYFIVLILYVIVFFIKMYVSNIDINDKFFPVRIIFSLFLAFLGLLFCLYKIDTYTRIKLTVLADKIVYQSYTKNKSYEIKISDITNIYPYIIDNEIVTLNIKTNFRKYKIKYIENLGDILKVLNESENEFTIYENITKIDRINNIINKIFIMFILLLSMRIYLLNENIGLDKTLIIVKLISYYLSNLYIMLFTIITIWKRKVLSIKYNTLIVVIAVTFIIFIYHSIFIIPQLIKYILFN